MSISYICRESNTYHPVRRYIEWGISATTKRVECSATNWTPVNNSSHVVAYITFGVLFVIIAVMV
jgi:hypothetical protein